MPPQLLLDQAEIAEIREKIGRYPWAGNAYAALKANADAWAGRPEIHVPDTGGGFYHAADATNYQITLEHYRLADAARDLGLVFQLTGDPGYLPNARAILSAYAAKYLTFEIHDKAGRTGADALAGGRTTPQGINEATWIISLTWAYDLVRDELTPAEREAIEGRILRPAAELIMDNNEGRHNHQTWYNSGVGVIGLALADEDLVRYALDKEDSGFRLQMRQSITADGMWYEGSMHYQFYVLQALCPLMEAAYHAGIDVYGEPAYKSLFDFMLDYADAHMKLPAINDGRIVDLTEPDRATYYEVAFRRLGDPRYAAVLRASARTDLNALLYGVGELPETAPERRRSRYFAASRLAVLRAGSGADASQAVLSLMGYQGGHSHPDQLGLVLHGLGQVLAPDAGSIKYRIPAHVGYFKQSVAHNVLVVDGRSQAPAPPATLEAFAATSSVQVARAAGQSLYPGVAIARTLLLAGNYLVDIVEAASDGPHIYDWVYHNLGRITTTSLDFRPETQAPGHGSGYEYLQNMQAASFAGDWQAVWQIDANCHVRLTQQGAPGSRYFLADGLIAAEKGDEIAGYAVPLIIARREAARTRYLTLVEPFRRTPAIRRIEPVEILDQAGRALAAERVAALAIEQAGGHDLLVLADEDGAKHCGPLRFDGRLLWASYAGGALRSLFLAMGSHVETGFWSLRLASSAAVVLEIAGPQRVLLHNCSVQALAAELAGLPAGRPRIWRLDADGRRSGEVAPSRHAAGSVSFVMEPLAAYELAGEPL